MAHVYGLRLFPGKIRFCQNSFPYIYIPKQYTTVRKLCLSACQCKNPLEKINSKSEPDSEYDLDFFGVNQADNELHNGKSYQPVIESEKKSVYKSMKRYLQIKDDKANKSSNIERTGYGSVRFDNSNPMSEKPRKFTRKERRLQTATINTDTFPKFLASHKDKKIVDYIDKSYLASNTTSSPLHKNECRSNNKHVRENQNQLLENEDSFSTGRSRNSESNKLIANQNKLQKPLATSKPEISFIEDQYFINHDSHENIHLDHSRDASEENTVEYNSATLKSTRDFHGKDKVARNEEAQNVCNIEEQDLPCIDKVYFGDYNNDSVNKSFESEGKNVNKTGTFDKIGKLARTETTDNISKNELESGFVDEQYFNRNQDSIDTESQVNKEQQNRNPLLRNGHERKNYPETAKSIKPMKLDHVKLSKSLLNENLSSENSQSVYAESMKVRKEFEKKRGSNLIGTYDPKEYDSKGFRILKNQVPNFHNTPSIDILKVLRRSIIYDDHDIIALSKPYGIPSYDGQDKVHSVGDLLDEIIPNTRLFAVHRLDKETTGVMLLAKTEEMQKRLRDRFYTREIVKKYLVITKNIPEMPNGEIDIPITEGTVQGKVRMCLRPYDNPEFRAIAKKRQPGKIAVTKFKVLDQGQKCALLECYPKTGKKHQIRVHLAFGLNCPILGDHKYSHSDKLAPMLLHPEILHRLHIQQSKVRYLAMHLHARSIMIPEFLDGKNLFITAPVPPHFVRNMKDLKLEFPRYA